MWTLCLLLHLLVSKRSISWNLVLKKTSAKVVTKKIFFQQFYSDSGFHTFTILEVIPNIFYFKYVILEMKKCIVNQSSKSKNILSSILFYKNPYFIICLLLFIHIKFAFSDPFISFLHKRSHQS
jgi:hypothetical protein